MATQRFTRSLLCKPQTLASLISRSVASRTFFSVSTFRRLRPLSASLPASAGGVDIRGRLRCFATNTTSSSLNDPNPNWSNRPPKETILLDGCDFEHWLVVMETPEGDPTRDEIIDKYIKTLAQVVGSEQEARMKIYSVSTRCYFAFGCLVSEELSYKLKELPGVRWVLPDSYLDVKNKDYGGEPFINGEAVPYDPKYHEEWIRNNARANERNRRNDRPRNFDRSRNFERRRENMQNRDFQNNPMPNQGMPNGPMPNQGMPNNPMPNQGMPNNPNQGMANYPNQGMQNNPVPNYPNQGMQNNHMPPQGMQNHGYGNMENIQNRGHQQNYAPNSNFPNNYPNA